MTFRHTAYGAFFALTTPLLLISCTPSAESPQTENETTEQASELPKLPLPAPPMDRAQLLISVARAASAAALGQDDAEAQRELNGNRFEVRMRFGCPGSTSQEPESAHFDVKFDPEKRALRISAKPDIDLDGLAVTQGGEESVEAVEGFWVTQPWLLTAGCPAALAEPGTQESSEELEANQKPRKADTDQLEPNPAASEGPTLLSRSVGIAQYFTETDSRTVRRNGRAYEITRVLKDNERPSAEGYNLVLAGRLRSSPQTKVITCNPRGRNAPPECMISVAFDRVWVENPADKSVLAEWS